MDKDDIYFGISTVLAIIGLLGLDWNLVKGRFPTVPLTRKNIFIVIAIGGSLLLSGIGWYIKPKVVEKIVDRPVPQECPSAPTAAPAPLPDKTPKVTPIPTAHLYPNKPTVNTSPAVPVDKSSPPTFTVSNPTGSIINQDSTVQAPQTVNNFKPPLPQIDVTSSRSLTENEKQIVNGFDSQTPANPMAQVEITVKGAFVNPAFVVTCNVPCVFVTSRMMGDGMETSDSRDFSGLSSPNHMVAGVSFNRQMYSGTKVKLIFGSVDKRELVISNVQPYAP